MISGDASIVTGRDGAFYHMLERFARSWRRVDVIVPRPERVARTRVFDNVFLHPAAVPRPLQWRHILKAGRALHAERPYGLMTSHDYGWHYNGIGAWLLHRATGTPYVSEILHVTGHPRAASLKERGQNLATRLYIRLARHAVRGFRVDNAIELPELLRRLGVPPSQILVLYALYLDHDVFAPGAEPKQHDVMFCGRLDSNKGTSLLLEALALLAKRRPDVTLLLRGAGREEARLKRLADRLGISGRITWRPWVASAAELASLYRASRMLVCTSLSEGGPRVVAEAMACGTPVISTPVGITRELIDDGRTGLVVDWNPTSIAAGIERLLEDPAAQARIGDAGRTAVARFRREAVIDAYAQAYRRLVAGAAPELST